MEGAARVRGFSGALLLLVAACGGSADGNDIDALDKKLGGKGDADPALTSALEDQIMIDPTLSQQANEDAIRPPDRPVAVQVPKLGGVEAPALPTLGAATGNPANIPQFNGCSMDVRYSFGWANRLPAGLALPEKARVTEAAGSDRQGCALRAISFTMPSSPKEIAAYYRGVAMRAGYAAKTAPDEPGAMVSGVRASDGAAFYAIIQPAKGGVSVDLVSNRGR